MCYKFYYLWQGWAVILWSCIMISSNMAWCSCRFLVKGKPSPHIPKQIKIKWMDFVPLQIPQLEGCPCSSGTNLSCTCSNWHGFGNQKVHGGGNVIQWAGNLFGERYARCQPQGTTSLPDNAKGLRNVYRSYRKWTQCNKPLQRTQFRRMWKNRFPEVIIPKVRMLYNYRHFTLSEGSRFLDKN